MFRVRTKEKSAKNCAEIVNNRNGAYHERRKFLLHLQESRIDILRSVAERVEEGHQQNYVKKEAPISFNGSSGLSWLSAVFLPCGRFFDVLADIQHADHEHSAPTEKVKCTPVQDRCQQITGWIAGLENARN